MEFAVLAAGVDGGRQLLEQLQIEAPPREAGIQAARVHAAQARLQSPLEHLPGELRGGALPEGKDGFDARARVAHEERTAALEATQPRMPVVKTDPTDEEHQ